MWRISWGKAELSIADASRAFMSEQREILRQPRRKQKEQSHTIPELEDNFWRVLDDWRLSIPLRVAVGLVLGQRQTLRLVANLELSLSRSFRENSRRWWPDVIMVRAEPFRKSRRVLEKGSLVLGKLDGRQTHADELETTHAYLSEILIRSFRKTLAQGQVTCTLDVGLRSVTDEELVLYRVVQVASLLERLDVDLQER